MLLSLVCNKNRRKRQHSIMEEEASQESDKLVVNMENSGQAMDSGNDSGHFPENENSIAEPALTSFKLTDSYPLPHQTVDDVSDLVYLGRKRRFRRPPINHNSTKSQSVCHDFSEGFKTRLENTKLLTKSEVRWDMGGKVSYCAVDCSKMSMEKMKDLAGELFEIYYTDKSVGGITFARNWAVFTACGKNKRLM